MKGVVRESKSELNRKEEKKGYVLDIRGPVFLLRQEQFVTGCVFYERSRRCANLRLRTFPFSHHHVSLSLFHGEKKNTWTNTWTPLTSMHLIVCR